MDNRRFFDRDDFDYQNRPRNSEDRRMLGADSDYDYDYDYDYDPGYSDRSQSRPSWQPKPSNERYQSSNRNSDLYRSNDFQNRPNDFQNYRSWDTQRSPSSQSEYRTQSDYRNQSNYRNQGDYRGHQDEGFLTHIKENVKNFFGKGPKGYKRSDERIRDDVCDALFRHPRIDASEVEVSVKDGTVTLTGTVEDRQTKRLIEDVADDCSGVSNVSNQILVSQRSGFQAQTSQSVESQQDQKSSTRPKSLQ